MKKLLITGFDPFGGQTVNPSWEAVRLLPGRIGAYEVTCLQIPTLFGEGARKVRSAAKALHPDVILSVGQAGGRRGVTPEVVGINLREARIPDNGGFQPVNVPIVPDGPAAYFATVPVRAMVDTMTAAGLPCALSYSAGAFVCNDVLYTLLHHYHGTAVQAGFIHVPFLPEQAGDSMPSMPLKDIVRALTLCVGALG